MMRLLFFIIFWSSSIILSSHEEDTVIIMVISQHLCSRTCKSARCNDQLCLQAYKQNIQICCRHLQFFVPPYFFFFEDLLVDSKMLNRGLLNPCRSCYTSSLLSCMNDNLGLIKFSKQCCCWSPPHLATKVPHLLKELFVHQQFRCWS